jgi:hypothetical protein
MGSVMMFTGTEANELIRPLAGTKKRLKLVRVTTVVSTRGGNRTPTTLRPLDFESSASANSATLASYQFSDFSQPIVTGKLFIKNYNTSIIASHST